MKKGIIYYTDNRLDLKILNICQNQLRKSFKGEIINVSLAPMDFGTNIVFRNRNRSYPTYLYQILTALVNSTADVVYFTEHDVLYNPSHFDLTPKEKDIYYYNINNFRWPYPPYPSSDFAITHDGLTALSMLFCHRELAINHYIYRIKIMEKNNMDKNRSREPRWARRFGYEPGVKPINRGGITNEKHIKVKSKLPNIDIRHKKTFSRTEICKQDFKRLPASFKQVKIDDIPGWNLKKLFELQ